MLIVNSISDEGRLETVEAILPGKYIDFKHSAEERTSCFVASYADGAGAYLVPTNCLAGYENRQLTFSELRYGRLTYVLAELTIPGETQTVDIPRPKDTDIGSLVLSFQPELWDVGNPEHHHVSEAWYE